MKGLVIHMIMKNDITYFTKEAIVEFLREFGEPKTKDYELAATLIIHHFCEKRWGKDCWIGFRIRPQYTNSLPAYNSEREISLKEIAELLRKGIDEDSPVDFLVVKRASMQKAQGMVFQVKRFGIGRIKKDTDELVAYFNSFTKKYSKTQANLLICLDDGVQINMKKLITNFDTSNSPFNRILFTWLLDGMVFIKDVYPLGGLEKYLIAELY